jgi:hypothetical protein
MFRIEFLCDDKRLPKVLLSLNGLILADGLKVQPVVNAKVNKRNGKVEARTGGTALEMLADWYARSKKTQTSSAEIRTFLLKNGFSVDSCSSVIGRAIKMGMLKRIGKGGPGRPARYSVQIKKGG